MLICKLWLHRKKMYLFISDLSDVCLNGFYDTLTLYSKKWSVMFKGMCFMGSLSYSLERISFSFLSGKVSVLIKWQYRSCFWEILSAYNPYKVTVIHWIAASRFKASSFRIFGLCERFLGFVTIPSIDSLAQRYKTQTLKWYNAMLFKADPVCAWSSCESKPQ